jgi:hypothetical protein
VDEENNENITENPQIQYVDAIAEMADEESRADLEDDQMMAMDDQLTMIFKDRARGRKSKGAQSCIVQVMSVDEYRRGSTEKSHALQEPRYGSFGHFRSKATYEPVYLAIPGTASCPYIL